jgi:anthranilate synthase component 1
MPVSRDAPAGADPVALFEALGTGEGAVLLERPGGRAIVGLDPVTVATFHGDAVAWTSGPIGDLGRAASPAAALSSGFPCVAALGGDAFRARPDAVVAFPSVLVAFEGDHIRLTAPSGSRLDELAGRLATVAPPASEPAPPSVPEPTFASEIADAAYWGMIEAAHQRVVAGEAEQVTISRRFAAHAAADPLTVYRTLRATNPSPYHFLLRLPGRTLVGASPQQLAGVAGGQVSVPVIAGTRPRATDADVDAARADELLADPKERAEHAMLVELACSDLSRVAVPGTVRVDGPRVARYSRVMHLVSDVNAALAAGRTPLDVLAAAFPSGTVAGKPRDAALRIIDELEPRPRGLYGGGIGWLDPSGELDFCLGIRTLQFEGDTAYCQAGAGVVAGSVPDLEVRESRDKASALFAALEAAARPAVR